jgi:hypothetical protein
MPEIGEEISVDRVASIEHDEHCYFCKARQEPRSQENDLGDDYDEDLDLDGEFNGKFKNDAGKLGKALGASPAGQIKVDGDEKEVIAAAHHLIPGNAALKRSNLFKCKKYLWVDGKAGGNIGYNVNSVANGVWLPGNYSVRPWSDKSEDFKEKYAYAAMAKYKAQFHDAHDCYSRFVWGVLDKICAKLKATESILCPEVKKRSQGRNPQRDPPLYDLVSRLHTISGRMRSMLTGEPTRFWRRNIYTSRFALDLMSSSSNVTNSEQ